MDNEDNKEDTITINISDDVIQFPTLDVSSMASGTYNSTYDYTQNYPSINITSSPNTGGLYTIPTYQFHSTTSIKPSDFKVNGDAEFDGDIKWKGRSLGEMLETIEKRLSILQPDPEKLEHFEALRKAYEHYKMLEKLCELPKKENES